ncbi:MAG: flagellar biosynthesis anti-sigma factor FlgM [Planctomycetota bacterium]|nr:MAG: flagellar biosynthesis anti-sigma factor FlgM [Planctomycetota bacterium]
MSVFSKFSSSHPTTRPIRTVGRNSAGLRPALTDQRHLQGAVEASKRSAGTPAPCRPRGGRHRVGSRGRRIMINALSNTTSAPAQSPELREQLTQRGQPGNRTSRPSHDADDVVELSETARRQLETGESAPIREHLVKRIRDEIAAGTYLTQDKIEKTVDRLHRELFGR